MSRSAKAFLYLFVAGCVSYAQTSQTPARAKPDDTRADAYYNFAMGRVYAGLAELEGNRNDYVTKAIQHYQQALKEDPSASVILEELTDLYIGTGRLADAVTQAEDMLKRNPDDLEARRMLGRIYTRAIGRGQGSKVNEESLQKALEQYQKITEKDPKDVDSWVMLGRLYGFANNPAEAEKAYNAALAAQPDSEDALTGLAMLYSDMGDNKRAIEKLKVVTDKNPNEHTLAALASAYEQMHDYKDAADALRRAVALSPDNPRLVRGLAEDLMYSDQPDEALKLYQQMAADEPRDPDPQLRMAAIYRGKRDFVNAHKALDKAKTLAGSDNLDVRYEEVRLLGAEGKTPDAIAALKSLLADTAKKNYSAAESANRAMLLEQLGLFYQNSNQYQQAIDAYRQVAALDSEGAPRIAVRIIDAYRAAKDLDSAQREADAALKKFPGERAVVLEHANVLSDRGKYDPAITEVRGLLNGKADDREVLLTLAQIYEKAKRYDDTSKALDDADKYSVSNDDKVVIMFMRGDMYERQKKYDAAEAEFRKVLDLDPDNAGALNYLGYMYADRDVHLDEAYRLIKKALDLDPDNGAYLDSLGWVYYRQGKLADAEDLLTRALDHIGDDPTVHEHLGDVYFKLGKTREAITQWQDSLKAFEQGTPSDNDPEEVAKVTRKLEGARVRLAQETGAKK
jgi:tetratricopeptide (TPR) repeat protein